MWQVQRRGACTLGEETRDPMEDVSVDGMIILKCIFRKQDGGVDWVDLAQDRDIWWAYVVTVMYLRFP